MWKTCIVITINAIFTINFKCSFIPATLSLASITIFANENKITRAYTLSYSFYLILFGAFFCILSSAVLINVYVYRKWKNEHRMMKISRRDLRVAQPVHRGRTSDYGDDDEDDVPSEKRQYSDDDRSRYSEDMSKHSEDFSTKQSDIWARPTVWHEDAALCHCRGLHAVREYVVSILTNISTRLYGIYLDQKYLSITREVLERESVYLCNKGHRFCVLYQIGYSVSSAYPLHKFAHSLSVYSNNVSHISHVFNI